LHNTAPFCTCCKLKSRVAGQSNCDRSICQRKNLIYRKKPGKFDPFFVRLRHCFCSYSRRFCGGTSGRGQIPLNFLQISAKLPE
jgi:hypothetical protein